VKITAIQTSGNSQYLQNSRAFGTPNKIGFGVVGQLECN
jgi:hypothetical protein